MSPWLALALFALAIATATLSGVFGMAGGIVLMGALTLLLPVRTAMLLHGVAQLASNGWRAFVWRRHISWRVLAPYLAGAVASLGLFSWLQYQPEKAWVLLALGLVPFLAWAMPRRLTLDANRRPHAVLCGFVVVAMMIVCGVSGPVLDIFFVRAAMDRRAVIATKATTQSMGHAMKLVYFGGVVDMAGGFADLPWWIYAGAVVASVAGGSLAAPLLHRLTDDQFRRWTQRILLAIGTVYLLQGLRVLLLAAP